MLVVLVQVALVDMDTAVVDRDNTQVAVVVALLLLLFHFQQVAAGEQSYLSDTGYSKLT